MNLSISGGSSVLAICRAASADAPAQSMAELSVPAQFLGGINKLAKLPPAERVMILSAIRSEPPVVSRFVFTNTLAKKVAGIGLADASEMSGALLGMAAAATYSDRPLPEFVGAVVGSLSLGAERDEGDSLEEFLVEALSIPNLVVAAKAIDILTSHQRIYLRGRIFTDMRPVF